MRIAVSGSTGLVGSALCQRLTAQGHSIIPLVRPDSSSPPPAQSASLTWDPEQGLANPEAMDGIDAFIHLAGRNIAAARWTSAEKQRLRDSRVAATEKLVQQLLALDNPPSTILSASAVGIYGDCGDQWVEESQPADDSFLSQLATDWEAACDPLRAAGLRVIHPRLGVVLSSQGGALQEMLPIFRWRIGGVLGSGKQYWSWIALADCVAALQWLLDTPDTSGCYNLVAPQPVTNRQFTKTLSKVLGRSALFPVPGVALRLVLGELADALLLCSCRASADRLLGSGFRFEHAELAPFLERALHED